MIACFLEGYGMPRARMVLLTSLSKGRAGLVSGTAVAVATRVGVGLRKSKRPREQRL